MYVCMYVISMKEATKNNKSTADLQTINYSKCNDNMPVLRFRPVTQFVPTLRVHLGWKTKVSLLALSRSGAAVTESTSGGSQRWVVEFMWGRGDRSSAHVHQSGLRSDEAEMGRCQEQRGRRRSGRVMLMRPGNAGFFHQALEYTTDRGGGGDAPTRALVRHAQTLIRHPPGQPWTSTTTVSVECLVGFRYDLTKIR